MENPNLRKQQSDKLIFWGVLLFFLGLLSALFIPIMANPRMGLSGHLEGIMNGIFLIVSGLIWNRLQLSEKWLHISFILAFFGTFANFSVVLIAAFTGAGRLMPLAGGKEGTPVVESLISFLLISLSIAMLVFCIIILKGLYRPLGSGVMNNNK